MNKSLDAMLVKPALAEVTVTVPTSQMLYPLPHSAHIHCLISITIQQVSMTVTECHFLHVDEHSDTPLLHLHFHVRCQCVRPLLCCHLSHGNKMEQNIFGNVQPLWPYIQDPPLTSWGNLTK